MHIAAEKLEASYAGIIGKTIEPAIKPLGFDFNNPSIAKSDVFKFVII